MTRPCRRTRIVNLLHSVDMPLTAVDIGIKLNFTTQETSQLLRYLVVKETISCKSPKIHLGERFSSIYWFTELTPVNHGVIRACEGSQSDSLKRELDEANSPAAKKELI